jgi:transposase
MLDEPIICETPPLYSCYGRMGQQGRVPLSGNRSKRILPRVLNIKSGEVLLLITNEWVQETHQYFLAMIRSHWRGWRIVLFEDRGSPHRAEDTLEVAAALKIERRFLPRATPELNAMDHLWRHVKRLALADRPTRTIEESALQAGQDIFHRPPTERLRKAGVLSGNFWLTN